MDGAYVLERMRAYITAFVVRKPLGTSERELTLLMNKIDSFLSIPVQIWSDTYFAVL